MLYNLLQQLSNSLHMIRAASLKQLLYNKLSLTCGWAEAQPIWLLLLTYWTGGTDLPFSPCHHGLTNYIDIKAKCRHLKNRPVKGLCGRVFICLRPPRITYPPPPRLHTVGLYSILIDRERGGGGESWTREKFRGACNSSQIWVENDWCISSLQYKLW